jgi:hypothetical protein
MGQNKQKVDEVKAKAVDQVQHVGQKAVMEVDKQDKQAKATCFNCAEGGHFSTDCRELRLCFICQTTNHVGKDCPKWQKPIESSHYFGSAAQGFGFFHIDVQEEGNTGGGGLPKIP